MRAVLPVMLALLLSSACGRSSSDDGPSTSEAQPSDPLRTAAIRDLDASARDRAARALVAEHRGEPGVAQQLLEVGALEVLVESAADLAEHDRPTALAAALTLGDWQAAGRIAELPAGDRGENAAIVACLLGKRSTAIARLRESESNVAALELEHRLIELHCKLPLGPLGLLGESSRKLLLQEQSIYQGRPVPGMRLMNSFGQSLAIAQTASLQTEPLVWKDYPQSELFELLRRGRGVEVIYTRYDYTTALGLVAIADLESGARRLLELARDAPLELRIDGQRSPVRPRDQMIRAALWIAVTATNERLWRGQMAEAQADYALVRELLEREELASYRDTIELKVLGLAGYFDRDGARQAARASIDKAGKKLEPIFALRLAVILEHAGDLEGALAVAKRAYTSRQEVELSHWIYGSLLQQAGRASELTMHGYEDSQLQTPIEWFAHWWHASQADPIAQADYRWRSGGKSHVGPMPYYLPVALEIVARSAPPERRDLWLDVVSSEFRRDPLTTVRMRLATAERLGDATAVARWRAREAALLERLQDDRAVALYRLFR